MAQFISQQQKGTEGLFFDQRGYWSKNNPSVPEIIHALLA